MIDLYIVLHLFKPLATNKSFGSVHSMDTLIRLRKGSNYTVRPFSVRRKGKKSQNFATSFCPFAVIHFANAQRMRTIPC